MPPPKRRKALPARQSFTMISDSSTRKPASTPVIPTTECVPSRPSPYPSVQRVFLIQEVIALILAELSSKDLLCVGLSCRALYKSAMDRLWQTTSSIAQVLLSLPKELVEIVPCNQYNHPVLRITKVPEPDQWERVLRYSRRIRNVVSSRRDVCKYTIEMIERHCPGGHLFPNLREARLAGPSCAREISILIQPSLLTVHYEIDPTMPESWRLSSIAERAPALTTLRITDSKRPIHGLNKLDSVFVDPKLCAALSDTVLALKNLTAVEFMAALSPEALKHLSELPRLARLALQLRDENCMPLDTTPYPRSPFPSLQSLHVRGRNTTQLASWISSLRSPALTELRVFAEKRSPIEAAQGLLDAISGLQGLTVLRIQFANERYLATDDVFTPLLQKLSSLEEFILGGLAFNPKSVFLVAVVSAWPRLRNLELQHTCYSKPTAHRIPLRDLLILAQHCPTIERIAIPLSPYMYTNPTRYEDGVVVTTYAIPPLARSPTALAPAVNVPDSATPTRLPSSKLQALQISYGFEPEDYQCIAEFLGNVFPAARLTCRCPPRMRPALEDCVRTIMELKEKHIRARQPPDV